MKDKYGVKYKYPKRHCKDCSYYPCFIGMSLCRADFAMYGCTEYRHDNISKTTSEGK